jgi:hypothetical protein
MVAGASMASVMWLLGIDDEFGEVNWKMWSRIGCFVLGTVLMAVAL